MREIVATAVGTWHGTAGRDCSQCVVEQRSRDDGRPVEIDKFDHEHFRDDARLQERLRRVTQMQQAEASGAVREGTFIESPGARVVPTNATMAEMLEQQQAKLAAARRHQDEMSANRPDDGRFYPGDIGRTVG